MELKTDRLCLIPLELKQFRLFLEREAVNKLSSEMQVALMCLYAKALEHTDNFFYQTLWLINEQQTQETVGFLFFKGIFARLKSGKTEIGYMIFPEFRHHGYMEEALTALTVWALQQGVVETIIAETDKDNVVSQHVLEHCGFVRSDETRTCFMYEKSNKIIDEKWGNINDREKIRF